MNTWYIYAALVYSANGCIKKHSTLCYKQLTRELTKNRGGSKCCITKRSKISSNTNQLSKSLIVSYLWQWASPSGRVLKGC